MYCLINVILGFINETLFLACLIIHTQIRVFLCTFQNCSRRKSTILSFVKAFYLNNFPCSAARGTYQLSVVENSRNPRFTLNVNWISD